MTRCDLDGYELEAITACGRTDDHLQWCCFIEGERVIWMLLKIDSGMSAMIGRETVVRWLREVDADGIDSLTFLSLGPHHRSAMVEALRFRSDCQLG